MRIAGLLGALILAVISLYLQFIGSDLSKYFLASLCILAFVFWNLKGLIELGVESVRGQFYVIVGTGFMFQGLAFLFADFGETLNFGTLGIIFLTLTRLFFFASNVRYIWFFYTSGYYLPFIRLMILLISFSIIFSATFAIPNFSNYFQSFSPMIWIVFLDWGMVFVVLHNMLLLLDTEIGKRWAIGAIVILSFLLGDVLFIANFHSNFPVTSWTLAGFFMSLIPLIRD